MLWLRYVARMPDGRLPVQALFGQSRGPGLQGYRDWWQTAVHTDLLSALRVELTWVKLAQDRPVWRLKC